MLVDWVLIASAVAYAWGITHGQSCVLCSVAVHSLLRLHKWQLVPVYGALWALFLLTHPLTVAWSVGLSLVCAASAALLALLPVKQLPGLPGPYGVGRRVLHLFEEESPKPHLKKERALGASPRGNVKGQPIRVAVTVYFPTRADVPTVTTPYLSHGYDSVLGYSRFTGLPAFLFSHLTSLMVRDNARTVDIDGGAKELPLVLFSHGLGGAVECYSVLCRSLASFGYIVAAIAHNDRSQSATQLADGTTNLYTPLKTLQATMKAPSGEVVRQMQLFTRVREMRYVLDSLLAMALQPLHSIDPLYGRIDTTRVFTAGHSFGGATAFQTAKEDARVCKTVNLDGWQLPLPEETKLWGCPDTPALFVESEQFRKWQENYVSMHRMFSQSHPASRFFTIAGTRHQAFSDFPHLMPLALRLAGQGSSRSQSEIDDETLRLMQSFLQHDDGSGVVDVVASRTVIEEQR